MSTENPRILLNEINWNDVFDENPENVIKNFLINLWNIQMNI